MKLLWKVKTKLLSSRHRHLSEMRQMTVVFNRQHQWILGAAMSRSLRHQRQKFVCIRKMNQSRRITVTDAKSKRTTIPWLLMILRVCRLPPNWGVCLWAYLNTVALIRNDDERPSSAQTPLLDREQFLLEINPADRGFASRAIDQFGFDIVRASMQWYFHLLIFTRF